MTRYYRSAALRGFSHFVYTSDLLSCEKLDTASEIISKRDVSLTQLHSMCMCMCVCVYAPV